VQRQAGGRQAGFRAIFSPYLFLTCTGIFHLPVGHSMPAKEIIEQLQLLPHPEGGYYRETYRSEEEMTTSGGDRRKVCTAIYYLLEGPDKSHFHRIRSDELWFFHAGEPLEILEIREGQLKTITLGRSLLGEEMPFAVIPGNTWFAAHIKSSSAYSLVSCVVAPGFDFADFELAERATLIREYPLLERIITDFTRE
jgi:predicted cupin superfamily sugar epimerase